MIAVAKVVGTGAAVVLLGSLLAPPLYWLGQHIPAVADYPFARYFNRAVLAVALLALFPLLRWLGLKSGADLGLQKNPNRWRDLALGVGIAVPGPLTAGLMLVASGAFTWIEPFPWTAPFIALASGVAVSLIEEPFFRGALLGVMRRQLKWATAVSVVSVFFALVHFIKPHRAAYAAMEVDWLAGLRLLPLVFHRFADPVALTSGFVTLVLFGWILGWSVVQTRSLALAIGLHGGWVFGVRAFALTTDRVIEPGWWVGRGLRAGGLPLMILMISFALLWFLLRRRLR